MKRQRIHENVAGYGFVLPSLAALIAFMILPIIMAVVYSFTEYNGAKEPLWVGFRNFRTMLGDKSVKEALKTTVIYVCISVPVQTIVSLGLAALIAQNFQNKFGNFVRSTLFIPVVCSASLVATIWYYMFSHDANGAVNLILSLFGIPAQNWLGDPDLAFGVVCFVNIWKGVGYYMVIFYAGIMDIPRNLYEAAQMDGASKFQQFLHITMPGLKPITYLVVTLCSISSFQIFDISYVMTNGGPGYATTTLIHRIYVEAFKNWKFGYASAIACVMLVIILILTAVERKLFQEKVN